MAACAPDLIARDKDKQEKICITEQEFAVYHAVGVENYESETQAYPFFDGAERLFPNISPDLVADYRDKNSKSYLLRCLLRKDLKKKDLKRSYGGTSTTGFSRIGFNRGETEALVYSSWSGIGNTCESDFYLLRKENDVWKIVKKATMVIC